MAKKKSYPYRLGQPKTLNPMKEMSWCLSRHIKVNIEPEAVKTAKGWDTTGRYQLVMSQGNKISKSGYLFNKENVVDAVYDAYRKTYELNYGKETEEQSD